MQRYKVAIKTENGIANAMRKYCDQCGISIWTFLAQTVTERLQKPLDFSIAEIEEMQKRKYEKNAEFEVFHFGISDAIVQEKLRIIKDEYGIALSRFFVQIIMEKLRNLGCSFEDKTPHNPMRKNASVPKRKKTDAEKMWESMNSMRNSFMEISMRKK